jgi:hypothetical protein
MSRDKSGRNQDGVAAGSRRLFSPREFLKGRRPERFSDTVRIDEPTLDRAMLEYHVATLTSRGQENDFEHFARHLAQKEICPNLLPQTGPTGGGDSKVDSETYPVADDLSLAWYVGTGREAASERWAFAFSAKEKWRPKVRSDVEKIAKTGRGYKKAFFVTNQFVSDRSRAEVEDELTKKHGLDVRILDRTWILDKVFENRHEDLAIEDLRLQTSVRTSVRKGPRDVQNEQSLEAVEGRIAKASEEGEFGPGFVDDCLEAAELARNLERPRTEIDGRFERAERAAEEHGSRHQQLVCAYGRAWTAYWWYEDSPNFLTHYRRVEELASGSRNAYEYELLHNLWNILFTLARTREVDEAEVAVEERTRTLASELDRLSREEGRPSTALQARSLRSLVQLLQSVTGGGDAESAFQALQAVVRESRGLVGFPLEPLVETLMELGKFLGELPGYQDLIEAIIEVTSDRSGEVKAAQVLLARGEQQLDADRPTEAIRSIGRALARLYKHESRHDLVRALYLCGVGYERVGLLWAARGTMLHAASVATNDFWSYEEVTRQQAACYSHLKWLELRLGRIPQLLAWHEVDGIVRAVLAQQGYQPAGHADTELNFDAILGILLLRTDHWQLKHLTRLPDVLDKLGLFNASIALRFALGDEASVAEDLRGSAIPQGELTDYFGLWRDQPAGERLPTEPQFYDRRRVSLSSSVLGCRITAESDNDHGCVALAESTLAILESLFSTGIVDGIIAREPTLAITIRKVDFSEQPFGFDFEEVDGRHRVEVRCGAFDWTATTAEAQATIRGKLFDLIAGVMARVFVLGDLEEVLTKLFRDDRALERSIDFTMSFATIGNVLGHSPRTTLSAWSDPEAREYELTRTEQWDASLPREEDAPTSERADPIDAASTPPHELFRGGRLEHSQMQTVSLIRLSLWDRAKWRGTAFFCVPDNAAPPLLAPVFDDATASGEIFRLWHEDLGDRDEKERLRVTIIRGVNKNQPYSYRVVFNVNPDAALRDSGTGLAVMVARVHTMEPSSHENLDRFIEHFRSFGIYGLAHCTLDSDATGPDLVDSHIIAKREVFIRDAWKIGPNDIDAAGLHGDDDPIIPPDQPNAPVLELLRKFKSR